MLAASNTSRQAGTKSTKEEAEHASSGTGIRSWHNEPRTSMMMRPEGLPPIEMSKKTLGLAIFGGCGVELSEGVRGKALLEWALS